MSAARTIRVIPMNGAVERYAATAAVVDNGNLLLRNGDDGVAVYAAGQWLSATDDAARYPNDDTTPGEPA